MRDPRRFEGALTWTVTAIGILTELLIETLAELLHGFECLRCCHAHKCSTHIAADAHEQGRHHAGAPPFGRRHACMQSRKGAVSLMGHG